MMEIIIIFAEPSKTMNMLSIKIMRNIIFLLNLFLSVAKNSRHIHVVPDLPRRARGGLLGNVLRLWWRPRRFKVEEPKWLLCKMANLLDPLGHNIVCNTKSYGPDTCGT